MEEIDGDPFKLVPLCLEDQLPFLFLERQDSAEMHVFTFNLLQINAQNNRSRQVRMRNKTSRLAIENEAGPDQTRTLCLARSK
jgi:hypothetical protein